MHIDDDLLSANVFEGFRTSWFVITDYVRVPLCLRLLHVPSYTIVEATFRIYLISAYNTSQTYLTGTTYRPDSMSTYLTPEECISRIILDRI